MTDSLLGMEAAHKPISAGLNSKEKRVAQLKKLHQLVACYWENEYGPIGGFHSQNQAYNVVCLGPYWLYN